MKARRQTLLETVQGISKGVKEEHTMEKAHTETLLADPDLLESLAAKYGFAFNHNGISRMEAINPEDSLSKKVPINYSWGKFGHSNEKIMYQQFMNSLITMQLVEEAFEKEKDEDRVFEVLETQCEKLDIVVGTGMFFAIVKKTAKSDLRDFVFEHVYPSVYAKLYPYICDKSDIDELSPEGYSVKEVYKKFIAPLVPIKVYNKIMAQLKSKQEEDNDLDTFDEGQPREAISDESRHESKRKATDENQPVSQDSTQIEEEGDEGQTGTATASSTTTAPTTSTDSSVATTSAPTTTTVPTTSTDSSVATTSAPTTTTVPNTSTDSNVATTSAPTTTTAPPTSTDSSVATATIPTTTVVTVSATSAPVQPAMVSLVGDVSAESVAPHESVTVAGSTADAAPLVV